MQRGASLAYGLSLKWSPKTRYVLCPVLNFTVVAANIPHLLLMHQNVTTRCYLYILASLAAACVAPGLVPARAWSAPPAEPQPNGTRPE